MGYSSFRLNGAGSTGERCKQQFHIQCRQCDRRMWRKERSGESFPAQVKKMHEESRFMGLLKSVCATSRMR